MGVSEEDGWAVERLKERLPEASSWGRTFPEIGLG
jgi:hypothetical protein